MGEAQPFLPGLEAAPGTVMLYNRKYLGSKFRLLDFLAEAILSRAASIGTFADPFAGTGAVAHRFLRHAGRIIAGDLLYCNYVVLRAFLCSTAENVDGPKVTGLVRELNALPPRSGYVTRSYGGTYFTGDNAGRIDAVREAIEALHRTGLCSDQERLVLLTSLLLGVDKVANTVGQYDAFLKHLEAPGFDGDRPGRHLVDSNVHKPLQLLVPAAGPEGPHEAYNEDANRLVRRLDVDVLYLDPPYNTRQYVDCYHVLENIMRWEKPRLYGKTRKFPREHLKSRYSRRQEAAAALSELVESARAEHIFLSYNDEGIIPDRLILEILERRGRVEVLEREYPVFGNGAGSSRKRMIRERLFYCRPNSRGPRRRRPHAPRPQGRGNPDELPRDGPGAGGAAGRTAQSVAPDPTPYPEAAVPDPSLSTDVGPTGKVELFDEKGNSRGFYSGRNRLNDLTGREWVYWSKSVITNPYPSNLQHGLRSRHGGQKPPELCADLIRVFTKSGQRVLDPFAGVGGTLLGASLCGRQAVGIEVNPEWVDLYRQVCSLEGIPPQRLLFGDSRELLGSLAGPGEPPFDLLLTDVPFWGMDRVSRSKGKFKRVGEPQRETRASKLSAFNDHPAAGKQQWRNLLRYVFAASLPLLRPGAYVVSFIGDMYHDGRFHFLAAELSAILEALGLTPKANLIWYDVSKSLHVYGYQYEFIPSMIHQNILVFRKGRRGGGARGDSRGCAERDPGTGAEQAGSRPRDAAKGG